MREIIELQLGRIARADAREPQRRAHLRRRAGRRRSPAAARRSRAAPATSTTSSPRRSSPSCSAPSSSGWRPGEGIARVHVWAGRRAGGASPTRCDEAMGTLRIYAHGLAPRPTPISISTPLGADKLLLRALRGRGADLRRSSTSACACSPRRSISTSPRSSARARRSASCSPTAARATSTASSAASCRRGRDQRFATYHAELVPWLWMLRPAPPTARSSRTRPRRTSSSRSSPISASPTSSDALTGTYDPARVLRAVQRDRLRLRLPPDGGGGHLLLLRARGRQAHPGARRRLGASAAVPGRRPRVAYGDLTDWEQQNLVTRCDLEAAGDLRQVRRSTTSTSRPPRPT